MRVRIVSQESNISFKAIPSRLTTSRVQKTYKINPPLNADQIRQKAAKLASFQQNHFDIFTGPPPIPNSRIW